MTEDKTAKSGLAGRHVLVTGASSGIGRAAARAIAARGATVLALARRGDELASLVAEIRASGGKAYGFTCDITDSASVDRAVQEIANEHGHVDMLVNNAGRSIRRAVHRSTDRMHDFERTMAVNYFGAVRLTLALLPQMRARGFGHVVNISSAGVQVSTPRFAAYLASKAALDKFTDVAAAETLSSGVSFTTIHMPLVRTPMITPTGDLNVGPVKSPEWAAAAIVRALVERPKRIDTPQGTFPEYAALLAPRLKDRVLHRYYRAYPDSAAAKGEDTAPAKSPSSPAGTPGYQPPPAPVRVAGRVLRRAGRWIPGVQW